MSLKALAIPLLIWCGITACGGGHQTSAPIIMTPQPRVSTFRHIVLIIQENRIPDNLFQGLCTSPFGSSSSCSARPSAGQYNIQTAGWLDKKSPSGTIPRPQCRLRANTI
jgi:phospholipase C